jgi:hypothetical protein
MTVRPALHLFGRHCSAALRVLLIAVGCLALVAAALA